MLSMIKQFKDATPETKNFFFQTALYLVIILGTVIYAYGRLDYVRSYDKEQGRYKQEQAEANRSTALESATVRQQLPGMEKATSSVSQKLPAAQ